MRMMLGLGVLAFLLLPSVVGAQCAFDFDRSGSVTAAELLVDRHGGQTAPGANEAAVIAEMFSTCPDFCRLGFADNTATAGYFCKYHGTIVGSSSAGCSVGDVDAEWLSDGTLVTVRFPNVVITSFPGRLPGALNLGATRVGPRAEIEGWWTDTDPSFHPVEGGRITLPSPSTLRIDPTRFPVKIEQCSFFRYFGEFTGRQ